MANKGTKTYKCNCHDKATVTIDINSNSKLCNVFGIEDSYNIKIVDKKVRCNTCDTIIYTEKK